MRLHVRKQKIVIFYFLYFFFPSPHFLNIYFIFLIVFMISTEEVSLFTTLYTSLYWIIWLLRQTCERVWFFFSFPSVWLRWYWFDDMFLQWFLCMCVWANTTASFDDITRCFMVEWQNLTVYDNTELSTWTSNWSTRFETVYVLDWMWI